MVVPEALAQCCWLCGTVAVRVVPEPRGATLVRVTGCQCAPAFLATRAFWDQAPELRPSECDAISAAIRRAATSHDLPRVDLAQQPEGPDTRPRDLWRSGPPMPPWVVAPLTPGDAGSRPWYLEDLPAPRRRWGRRPSRA
jgi:hypothetical protein